MESDFGIWKYALDVFVIPLVLTLIALAWPAIQAWYRRQAFLSLIRRELEEISPAPLEKVTQPKSWTAYQRKRYIHQKLFEEASQNRDFILSLPEDLVYYVSQLWGAKDDCDADQWLHFLDKLVSSKHTGSKKLRCASYKWKSLLIEQFEDDLTAKTCEEVNGYLEQVSEEDVCNEKDA
jgi:hypothetical protein